MPFTCAFGIHVISRTALIASLPSEISQAGAFAGSVAANGGRSFRTAIAGPAIWISVISTDALVAPSATVSFFAQTGSIRFFANPGLGPACVALAI